jgi:hypothetical protein
MATARRKSLAKRERVIPVKVTIDSRAAPTTLPPVSPAELRPAPVVKSTNKEKFQSVPSVRAINQSVHDWPEDRRRRLMWWLVGGGTVLVIIGWLAVVQIELSGPAGPNIFQEAARLIKSVRWPSPAKPTAAEQEIRNLDQQVFPQFTNQ